jgi:hypothetical protein
MLNEPLSVDLKRDLRGLTTTTGIGGRAFHPLLLRGRLKPFLYLARRKSALLWATSSTSPLSSAESSVLAMCHLVRLSR